MYLKYLALEQFKGVSHAEYTFDKQLNIVKGPNGSGKTTLAIAWSWLFTDKDYDLQANPNVRPLGMAESEPSVTAICDDNGTEVTFRKYQTDLRTKKQKEEGAPVRISNKYEINSVPKSQKDFMKDLESRGINTEMFLMLSHPEVFTAQKSADCRKILFGMIGDVTDIDVAKQIPECERAVKALEKYTAEEIVAMSKVAVKRCKEQLESLPNQIIGMEKSKIEADPDIDAKIEAVREEINKIQLEIAEMTERSKGSNWDALITEVLNEKTALYNKANEERLSKQADAIKVKRDAEDKLRDAKRKLYDIETEGANINKAFAEEKMVLQNNSEEYSRSKGYKWSGNTVCPTCGQPLPKEQIDEAKKKFETAKEERLKDLTWKIDNSKKHIDEIKKEGNNLSKRKKAAEKELELAQSAVDAADAEVKKLGEPIQPDFGELDDKIATLKAEKSRCLEYSIMARRTGVTLNEKQRTLDDLLVIKGADASNAHIDEMIEVAKSSQREYTQKKADAEALLYQMQLISQRKNEMLSEAVNSHFTKVKFRLFVTQKNGEIKDDCTPLVLCADGEYRDMTYSANTAAIVAAKLDICQGLQKFYGQNLPIWLDGAECLDEENRKALKIDSQLILLCVSDDGGLVVE